MIQDNLPIERPFITPAKFLLHVRSYFHSFHKYLGEESTYSAHHTLTGRLAAHTWNLKAETKWQHKHILLSVADLEVEYRTMSERDKVSSQRTARMHHQKEEGPIWTSGPRCRDKRQVFHFWQYGTQHNLNILPLPSTEKCWTKYEE